jgi:hypothetical protein
MCFALSAIKTPFQNELFRYGLRISVNTVYKDNLVELTGQEIVFHCFTVEDSQKVTNVLRDRGLLRETAST